MRPYREIKRDVKHAISSVPEIVHLTHLDAHWVPTDHGYGTLVEVTMTLNPDMTIRESHGVARRARKAIEAISYVAEADIHLDLFDEDVYE